MHMLVSMYYCIYMFSYGPYGPEIKHYYYYYPKLYSTVQITPCNKVTSTLRNILPSPVGDLNIEVPLYFLCTDVVTWNFYYNYILLTYTNYYSNVYCNNRKCSNTSSVDCYSGFISYANL